MALFFTALLGVSVTILGYFIHSFNQESFIRETEAAIDAEIEAVVLWANWAEDKDIAEIIARSAEKPRRVGLHYYYLMDNDGKRIAGNIEKLPSDVSIVSEGILRFRIDGMTAAAKIHTFPDGRRLMVARNIDALESRYALMKVLSGLMIFLMFIVIGTSFLISTFVVRRTNDIAATAQDIMQTGDLSRRISVATRWDDLSYLSDVLNAFLGRIDDLMQGIRHVSDNIAHDLRTPLTRLKNRMEALAKREEAAQNPQLHDDILSLTAEADRILSTFNALLRIANIEKGERHGGFIGIDWDDLIRDVTELYEPLAEEKNIAVAVSVAEGVRFSGDRDLVFQAMANLLDNAVKFTPEGGRIAVDVLRDKDALTVAVTNSGGGIDKNELPHLFDRFYRGEKSRHTPGNGLGLSLVAAIAALHKGQAFAENTNDGFRISMRFSENMNKI